jgi:hypothetical protein
LTSNAVIVLLMDEVESLAATRQTGGGEPADAVRAVNALLTQLDALRRRSNVVVLATSNLSGAVDPDRADVRLYIGPPRNSCAAPSSPAPPPTPALLARPVVAAFAGLSGRALRKLPFLTPSWRRPRGRCRSTLCRYKPYAFNSVHHRCSLTDTVLMISATAQWFTEQPQRTAEKFGRLVSKAKLRPVHCGHAATTCSEEGATTFSRKSNEGFWGHMESCQLTAPSVATESTRTRRDGASNTSKRSHSHNGQQ